MPEGPPKSAVELAMEKLAKRDAEAGDEMVSLSAGERRALAEVRRDYDAKVAETRILHDARMAAAVDPAAREALQEEYRRDLSRLASFRDKKIAAVRSRE